MRTALQREFAGGWKHNRLRRKKAMRKSLLMAILAVALLVAVPAVAELQNVCVGGSIRIRANYYTNIVNDGPTVGLIWPGAFLPKRPIGTPGNNIFSALIVVVPLM